MTLTRTETATSSGPSLAYSGLIGLTSAVILLQAVWAGLFIREGKDNDGTWVTVHARGADLAIVLALAALMVLLSKVRERRDLVFGTAGLVVLLVLESFLGGLVGDHPGAEVVHFPLAMALLGLSVWLPLRSRAGERGPAAD